MSSLVVFKGDDGKLHGYGETGARAWAKFCRRVAGLAVGDTLGFSWREPRSPRHHAFFFAWIGALADRQEQFETAEKLRLWLTVGAGYCDFAPGPDGCTVAIPQSIAFEKLDEADFDDLHRKAVAFLWTDQARAFLWPHLSDRVTFEMVEQLRMEFS